MTKYKGDFFSRDYDYEEDDYDRMKNIKRNGEKKELFTNKATMKKFEFDYEEDAYEPEKGK